MCYCNFFVVISTNCICPLSPQQEFPASWCWSERGTERAGSRVCHRDCGWCRSSRHCPAAPAFCRHDFDPDLCWGAGALRPHCGSHSVHKISLCIHKHHLIHSTLKQQEQIGDFHLLPLHPVDLTGWDGNGKKNPMLAVDLGCCVLGRCDLSILFKAIQLCQVLFVYRSGMKMYWLLWDDVWTVCLICCLILICTVIQRPSTPVNVVTSLCCECEYKCLPPCLPPFLPSGFLFYVGDFDCNPLFWNCWIKWRTLVFSFRVLLGTMFESAAFNVCFFFFTIYGKIWRYWQNGAV